MAAVAPSARATGAEPLRREPRERAAGLYERHSGRVFRFCLSRLRSREAAEDAVQTTFLNAQRALARGVVPIAESAWLLKIAHNVCLAHWSEEARRLRYEDTRDALALGDELVGVPRSHDELLGLERALEELPAPQQRAILLRDWQGLSYREIAAELGVSQAAVETLIFRGRRALAAALRGEEPEKRRRGLARALDLGSLASALKSALAGLSGAKAAALAAAVAAGVAAAVALPFEPPEPVRSAPPPLDRPVLAPAGEQHGSAAALAETLGLHAPGAAVVAAEESPAPAGEADAPEEDVVAALDEAADDVVGAVEETADSLVGTASGTTSALTETVESTADAVLDAPALPEAELLDTASLEPALDDAVSTLP